MQREISNVAKVCHLPGFRYVAFAPLVLPEPARPRVEAVAPEMVESDVSDHAENDQPPVSHEPAPAVAAASVEPVAAAASLPAFVAERPLPRSTEELPRVTPLPQRPARAAYALLGDVEQSIAAWRAPASVVPLRPQPLPQPEAIPMAAAVPRFALLAEVTAMITAEHAARTAAAVPVTAEPAAPPRPRAARKRSGRVA